MLRLPAFGAIWDASVCFGMIRDVSGCFGIFRDISLQLDMHVVVCIEFELSKNNEHLRNLSS